MAKAKSKKPKKKMRFDVITRDGEVQISTFKRDEALREAKMWISLGTPVLIKPKFRRPK